jgi:2-iminobutanoate/2-iminopropanoate deaminase
MSTDREEHPLSSKEPIVPEATFTAGAYSPALRVGDLVFVSGQGPFDAAGAVVGDSVEEQTAQCLENVRGVLAAAGLGLDDVVKVTVYLCDFAYFDRYDAVYSAHFCEPRPTRTTVAAGLGGILVEIDAIACDPHRR